MKKLSFIHKVLFTINILFIVGLFFAFILPYLPPEKFGLISLLSLIVPILLFGTLIFLIFWLLTRRKKQVYINLFILILSFFFIPSLYKLSGGTEATENELSIMSYNVRKFNMYEWIKSENIPLRIREFMEVQQPDIIAFQEYQQLENFSLNYPYISNPIYKNKLRSSLAIFSKYPIISEGVIRFGRNQPSAIYADIKKGTDTLRIYNFRFNSLGIIPDKDFFGHPNSEKLLKRLRSSFKIQEKQLKALNNDIEQCKYKMILAGDMNNTAYSWMYKHTKNEFNDSFSEAGKGFGKTYSFNGFPLRIDYIFVDKSIKIRTHENFRVQYSDHFPIMTTLSF